MLYESEIRSQEHAQHAGGGRIAEILAQFEQNRDNKIREAHVMLLQIPQQKQHQTHYDEHGSNEFQIVGFYASHGWSRSDGIGNDSCFLFNLTQNLRLNAVPKRGPYLNLELSHHNSRSRDRIAIGGEALTIENDFHRITSKITTNSKFAFGNEPQWQTKVDSIIPGAHPLETPTFVEIWKFSLRM